MGLNVGVFPGDGNPANNPAPVSQTTEEIKYVVEVYRDFASMQNIYNTTSEVELVKPGGTLVNVGAGPELPANPYEGQVWILT